MFKRILVPLDGSQLAERAIPHAATFARLFDGKIILQQTLDPSQTGAVEPLGWQLRKAEADVALRSAAARLRETGLDVEHVIMEGRTPASIVDYAQSAEIDLIVISTHGAGGLSRWNRSSVIGKVIEKAYTSILVVRAYQDWESSAQAEERPSPYRRVLLPFDSSRRAECSLPVATTLVEGLNSAGSPATLTVATVIKPPDLPIAQPYAPEITALVDQLMAYSLRTVNEYLQELASRLPAQSEIRTVESASVPGAIHQLAGEVDANGLPVDLVIMCAHGQSGQTGWPYGSIAHNYVEYGDKHVLIIQDLHRAQVRPSSAELAAEKYGKR